ncbi:type II toxin-antitoxin system PemK/MazF family toxin [Companilactobacillus muriivasis]|uniref:type II toxin-antitoxin system PemK/MazF family toxin n=1 Tax=Companilactobacillus muriivasis TaxID=3081444 RepID=UPI0030C6A824
MENYYAINAKSISQFNNIYFGIPHNQMFKLHYMRQWMEFYGYWLTREKKHNTPKYYTTFTSGSVVMVNFGPNIGNELSGNHFAIVLNKTDKRENTLLTVIPLSSKDHSNYLSLDKELFKSIYKLANTRLLDLEEENTEVLRDLANKIKKIVSEIISYNSTETLKGENTQFFLRDSLNGFTHHMHDFQINIPKYIDLKNPNKLEKLIDKIVDIRDQEFKKDNDEFYRSRLSTIIDKLNSLCDYIKDGVLLNEHIDNLQELMNKMQKYSKNTFAIIPNVTTVSKLRVVKISHYTISKNVIISDNSLKKIHKSIKNFQNLND